MIGEFVIFKNSPWVVWLFGIAERFVQTLKQWLADKHWQDEHQLHQCLLQFLTVLATQTSCEFVG